MKHARSLADNHERSGPDLDVPPGAVFRFRVLHLQSHVWRFDALLLPSRQPIPCQSTAVDSREQIAKNRSGPEGDFRLKVFVEYMWHSGIKKKCFSSSYQLPSFTIAEYEFTELNYTGNTIGSSQFSPLRQESAQLAYAPKIRNVE